VIARLVNIKLAFFLLVEADGLEPRQARELPAPMLEVNKSGEAGCAR
jgi:hypothetical protein